MYFFENTIIWYLSIFYGTKNMHIFTSLVNGVKIVMFLEASIGRSSPLRSTLFTNLATVVFMISSSLSQHNSGGQGVKSLEAMSRVPQRSLKSPPRSSISHWPVSSPGSPPPDHSSDTSWCSHPPAKSLSENIIISKKLLFSDGLSQEQVLPGDRQHSMGMSGDSPEERV